MEENFLLSTCDWLFTSAGDGTVLIEHFVILYLKFNFERGKKKQVKRSLEIIFDQTLDNFNVVWFLT